MFSRARWSPGLAVLCSLALLASAAVPLHAQSPDAPGTEPLPASWARADLLLWHVQGTGIPALVTASRPGTARADAAVLTNPNTVVYFGNQHVNNEIRPGFSLEGGYLGFGDAEYPIGVMANFWMLESVGEGFRSDSDGSFALGRPFFNVTNPVTNQGDARLVSFPGEVRGFVDVRTRVELLGTEFNFMQQVYGTQDFRVAAYIGYRFLRYRDRIWIRDSSEAIDPLSIPGTTVATADTFDAFTNFHGCNFGLDFRYHVNRLSLTLRTSMAVGHSTTKTNISGQTAITVPPEPTTLSTGGLLALPTNIGERKRRDAAILPQLGVTLGYSVTDWAWLSLGYDFWYLSAAASAGASIDIGVNPTQFPPNGTLVGAARPGFFAEVSEVWAQGLRLGVEFVY